MLIQPTMPPRRSFDSIEGGEENWDGSNKRPKNWDGSNEQPKTWRFHDPAAVSWPEKLWPKSLREGDSHPPWLIPTHTVQSALDHAWRSEWNEHGLPLLPAIWNLFESPDARRRKVRSFFKKIYEDHYKGDSSVRSLPLLHMVALCRLRVSLKFLLSVGEDVNQQDELGLTALHRCAEAHSLPDMVKLLLENGADETIRDTFGHTALHRASVRGEHYMADVLGAHSKTVNARDHEGRTPLHNAIQCVSQTSTQITWEPQTAQDQEQDPDDFMIIRVQKTIDTLLEKGANINARDTYGYTPLHLAVGRRCEGITTYLLQQPRIDVNIPDARGYTPLFTAAEYNDFGMLKQLFSRTDVRNNCKTRSGRNLLSVIAEMPAREGPENQAFLVWVESLIHYMGAEADEPDTDGRTPLSYAAEAENKPLVRLLLNAGNADPSRMDNTSCTPLSYLTGGADALVNDAGLPELGPGGSLIERDEIKKPVDQLTLSSAIDVAEVKDKAGRTPPSNEKAEKRDEIKKPVCQLSLPSAIDVAEVTDKAGRIPPLNLKAEFRLKRLWAKLARMEAKHLKRSMSQF